VRAQSRRRESPDSSRNGHDLVFACPKALEGAVSSPKCSQFHRRSQK
jgi:hypothetical protein